LPTAFYRLDKKQKGKKLLEALYKKGVLRSLKGEDWEGGALGGGGEIKKLRGLSSSALGGERSYFGVDF